MIVHDTHIWVWWVHGDPSLTAVQERFIQPIVVDSTQLPSGFRKDPADQLIVSTARVHGCPPLTADEKIISYPHVMTL